MSNIDPGEIAGKAEDYAKQHPDQARSALDKATEALDHATGDKFDGAIKKGESLLEGKLGIPGESGDGPALQQPPVQDPRE